MGLVEERSGSSTTYPLADAHGDITTIADQAGGVASRQTYDPWGTQLSGPTRENGFLGAYQRPTDPMSGLIQMGARPYDPNVGRFISEDPVLGVSGVGRSANRYPYALENPLLLDDLDGRLFSCPSWAICPDDIANGAQDVVNAGEDAADFAGDRLGDFGRCINEGWIDPGATSPCHKVFSDISDFLHDLLDEITHEPPDVHPHPPEEPPAPPPCCPVPSPAP